MSRAVCAAGPEFVCEPVRVGTAGGCESVELRVHGISGATAEKALDHPIVVRVAGDHNAGFYQIRPGTGAGGGATEGSLSRRTAGVR